MKKLFLWLAFAGSAFSGLNGQNLFETNQPADIILGPYAAGSNASGLHVPGRIVCVGSKLFVADTRNNRILIWNEINLTNNQPADIVLGQPDFQSNYSGTSASQLSWPYSVHSDGNRVFVADSYNNRVLIWLSVPELNGQPADIVLGQVDFYTSEGEIFGPTAIIEPWDVCFDGKRLFVACARGAVMVWNSLPDRNNQPADIILGKKDFYDQPVNEPLPWNTPSPRAVVSDGQHVVIHDYTLERLLVWNTPPTENGQPADLVLGQKDFYSRDGVSTIATSHGGLWIYENKLFCSGGETYLWNEFPTQNNQPPDAKIAWTHSQGVCYNGTNLFVSNFGNSRILIYDDLPDSPFPGEETIEPVAVLGQNDVNLNIFFGPLGAGQVGEMLVSTGSKLLFGGDYCARMVVHQELPVKDGEPADNIISLYNWYDIRQNPQEHYYTPMTFPNQSWSDGERLFVSDRYKGVMVWDKIPEQDHVWWNYLLFPNARCGSYQINQDVPWGVTVNGEKLIINDFSNNRILIWNAIPEPFSSPEPDVVLNIDRPPMFVASAGDRLAVASYGGVLIWNTFPTTNDEPYDFILKGSPENPISISTGVFIYDDMLFVSDSDGHRVCIFESFPTHADQPYDHVLGQPDFFSRNPGSSRKKMTCPKALWFDGEYLWVSEFKFGDRLLGFKANIDQSSPLPPLNLRTGKITNLTVELMWDDQATNERGFILEIRENPGESFSEFARLSGNIEYFPASDLNKNIEYAFRIKAVNSYGESAYSNIITVTTLNKPNNPPGIPFNPHPGNRNEQNMEWFTFNWECSDPDEDDRLRYDLYLGNSNPPPLFAENIPSNIYHREYISLAGNTQYFWKVVAKDKEGATAEGPIWSFRSSAGPDKVFITIGNSVHGTTNPLPGTWEFSSGMLSYIFAIPDSLYQFERWIGNIPADKKYENPLFYTFESNSTIYAKFVKAPPTQVQTPVLSQYELHQNYPNPFDANSVISYSLPEMSMVQLSVYNLKGEVVEILVHQMQDQGKYSVPIHSRLYPAGVYFYVLNATSKDRNFSDVKKFFVWR
jgi:hypothetical protein